jgi:uncharacterized membrane protein (DUF485 family)
MWQEIAASHEFKSLTRAKFKVVAPATIFFIIYYFALPVLVGYAPSLMERKVFGNVNIAYLFALSQFFVAWGIAAVYLWAAARFDLMAKKIIERQAEHELHHAERKRDSAQPQNAERKRDSAQPQNAERKRDSAQPQKKVRKS